jgi:hypothetical protein
MMKLHRDKRASTKLAAALLVAGGALASMLVYASLPAGDLSPDAAPSDSMYRVAMVLSRDGDVIARPTVMTRQHKKFSIVVGSENVAGMSAYRYGINMIAAPHSDGIKIEIEGEIEFGADHAVVAKPRLVIAAGQQSSIEFSQDGRSAMRLDLTVNTLSAAEFDQVKNQDKKK